MKTIIYLAIIFIAYGIVGTLDYEDAVDAAKPIVSASKDTKQ